MHGAIERFAIVHDVGFGQVALLIGNVEKWMCVADVLVYNLQSVSLEAPRLLPLACSLRVDDEEKHCMHQGCSDIQDVDVSSGQRQPSSPCSCGSSSSRCNWYCCICTSCLFFSNCSYGTFHCTIILLLICFIYCRRFCFCWSTIC